MKSSKWIIPIVLVSVLIFILSLRQLSDPDLGFHLKYGKWITENLRVPTADLSTYTVPDHAYIDLHWLFQVILYQVYNISGYPGLSLFICLLGLSLSLLLMLRNRTFSIPAPVTAVTLLAGFLIIDPRIAPRPEMFTFLFLTSVLFILDLHAARRRNLLYLVSCIMLLWCNMHALFVLGLLVIVLYFISSWIHEKKPDRPLLMWMVISFLVCFANPYGIRGFSFPLELLTRFDPKNIYNQHIQEFLPFFSQSRFAIRDWLFLVLLGLSLLLTAFTFRKRKFHEIALVVLFAILAVGSIRNIPLFVLVALPVISRETCELNIQIRLFRRQLSLAVFILMIVIPMTIMPRLLTNAWYIANNSFNKTGLGIDSSNQPVDAAAFIANHHLDGRILNSIGFGGWLSWTLPQPIFIDGRLEVMKESLYREVTDSWNGGLASLISKYKPRLIIYNYLKYYPWTLQLRAMEGWRLVYVDGRAAVFTSDTSLASLPTESLSSLPSHEMLVPRESSGTWLRGFCRPTDYTYMDSTHLALFRLQMVRVAPVPKNAQEAVVCFNTANHRYRQGDIRGARSAYDSAVALNPEYAKAYNNRGILRASDLKDFRGAMSDFNRAIEIDSGYSDAYLCRGTTSFLLHDTEAACRDWKRAHSLGNDEAARLIGLHCNGK